MRKVELLPTRDWLAMALFLIKSYKFVQNDMKFIQIFIKLSDFFFWNKNKALAQRDFLLCVKSHFL